MLKRLAYTFFDDMQRPEAFEQCKIGNSVRLPEWAADVVRGFVGNDTVVSSTATLQCGFVKAGDVLWITSPTRLARLKLLVRAGDRHFAVVAVFRPVHGVWSPTEGDIVVVESNCVSGACCYLVLGDRILV